MFPSLGMLTRESAQILTLWMRIFKILALISRTRLTSSPLAAKLLRNVPPQRPLTSSAPTSCQDLTKNSAANMHTTALHCLPTGAIAALPEHMEPTCNPGARRRVPNRPSQVNMRQAVNVNAHTHKQGDHQATALSQRALYRDIPAGCVTPLAPCFSATRLGYRLQSWRRSTCACGVFTPPSSYLLTPTTATVMAPSTCAQLLLTRGTILDTRTACKQYQRSMLAPAQPFCISRPLVTVARATHMRRGTPHRNRQ